MDFKGNSPCNNCPYRKDAPLQHWSVDEFKDLISQDHPFGKVYGCHKNDKTICRGYLMNQYESNLPNIHLRLMQEKVTRNYLNKLNCKSERFESIEEMCEANFPFGIIYNL